MKLNLFIFIILCSFALSNNSFAESGLKVQTLVKTTKSWDGTSLPSYPQGQPEITILKIEIPPKTKLEPHSHPVINAGFLTKGKLTVLKKDGKILELNAGDSIVELVNSSHYGENRENSTAEIVVFYAGTESKPITIKDK